MNANKNLIFLLLFLLISSCSSPKGEKLNVATVETNFGAISFVLTNETPMHRDNFISIVNDSIYNKVLFHRVINNFVIQAGNPASKGIESGQPIPEDKSNKVVAAEIVPEFHHIRGAVGAARLGDNINPLRNSSATQFYIVHGGNQMALADSLITSKSAGNIDVAKSFKTTGGAPHLDGAYTIFGYVIDGMNVVDKIAVQKTGEADRPIENIIINKVDIKQMDESVFKNLEIYKLFNSKEK